MFAILFSMHDEVAEFTFFESKEDAEKVMKEKFSKYECYVAYFKKQ